MRYMAGVFALMLVSLAIGVGGAEAGVLSVVKKPCPWDPYYCDAVGLEFSDPTGERNVVTVRFTDDAVVFHDRTAPITIDQPEGLSWYWPIAQPYHGCSQINEQAVTCASLPSAGFCPGCQSGVMSGWASVSIDLGAGNDLLYADDLASETIDCGAGHDLVRYDAVDRRVNCEGRSDALARGCPSGAGTTWSIADHISVVRRGKVLEVSTTEHILSCLVSGSRLPMSRTTSSTRADGRGTGVYEALRSSGAPPLGEENDAPVAPVIYDG